MISFIKSAIIFLNTNNIKQARPISCKGHACLMPYYRKYFIFQIRFFIYAASKWQIPWQTGWFPPEDIPARWLNNNRRCNKRSCHIPKLLRCERQSKHTSMKRSGCILDKCWIKWWIKTDYEAARKKLACCTPKNIIENRLQYRDGTCNSNYHGKIISIIPSKTSPQSRR